ncbi:MAG: hypothetical protein LUD16_00480 [Lachnospiraceae bacterium]|nr:hypothetical protein [Lachnospiraceae bacterium]
MNQSNIIMYTTEDGLTKIETTFNEGELFKPAVVAKFATVQIEGDRQVSRNID